MQILAHRANRHGPDPASENSLESIRHCLERGWGLEIDIRRSADGRFYVAHDASDPLDATCGSSACAAIRQHRSAVIALNVKELGYEKDLIEYLSAEDVVSQVFLFDMELLEAEPGAAARAFRRLSRSVKLATRVSDHGESIEQALSIDEAKIVWLDEFERLWAGEPDILRLKRAGKRVYAVSPELHGFPLAAAVARWHQFSAWDVDGICTDYPQLLAKEFSRSREWT